MPPQFPGKIENVTGDQAFAPCRVVDLHCKFADTNDNQRVYLIDSIYGIHFNEDDWEMSLRHHIRQFVN